MNRTLKAILDELKPALEKCFPESQALFEVWPLASVEFGDVVSNICLEVGAAQRIDPHEVGVALKQALPSALRERCSLSRGFFNVRLDEVLESKYRLEDRVLAPKPHALHLPFSKVRSWPEARITALGVLQYAVSAALGVRSSLYLGLEPVVVETESVSTAELWQRLLRAESVGEFDATAYAGIALSGKEREGRCTMWLTPNTLPRKLFREVLSVAKGPGSAYSLQCPSLNWLEPPECSEQPQDTAEWSEKAISALTLYLSGGLRGPELDFSVPHSNEKANCAWFAGTLLKRLTDLYWTSHGEHTDKFHLLAPVNDLSSYSSRERAILMRVHFLDEFLFRASSYGEISELVSVFEDFLAHFSHWFHSATLRQRLANGELFEHEQQLMTGAFKRLSDMMKVWDSLRPWSY